LIFRRPDTADDLGCSQDAAATDAMQLSHTRVGMCWTHAFTPVDSSTPTGYSRTRPQGHDVISGFGAASREGCAEQDL